MSKNNQNSQPKITLLENDKLITDTSEVTNIFNNFYVNVADSIGKDVVFDPHDHPSLQEIQKRDFGENAFQFNLTDF